MVRVDCASKDKVRREISFLSRFANQIKFKPFLVGSHAGFSSHVIYSQKEEFGFVKSNLCVNRLINFLFSCSAQIMVLSQI